MAQLGSESSDDSGLDPDLDDEDKAHGMAYQAEVQRAREEQRMRAEQRREAVRLGVEREGRKKAESEARRAAREQAGHIKPQGQGSSHRGGATPPSKTGGRHAQRGSGRAGGGGGRAAECSGNGSD